MRGYIQGVYKFISKSMKLNLLCVFVNDRKGIINHHNIKMMMLMRKLPTPIVYEIWRWVGLPFLRELYTVIQMEKLCQQWHRRRFITIPCDHRPHDGLCCEMCERKCLFSTKRILKRLKAERMLGDYVT